MKFWLWRSKTQEEELDREVRTHLDMATDARVERGEGKHIRSTEPKA